MKEDQIIDMVSRESNWEEVLEYIIAEEGMSPWDVDLIILANGFMKHVLDWAKMDFKVPARVIIIAAILLRMKTEILMWEEKEEKEEKKPNDVKIDISQLPDLQPPAKRVPARRVTLEELVHALEKAFRTQELREERDLRARRKVEELVEEDVDEDIDSKIKDLESRIGSTLEQLRSGELTFSSLVPKWERKDIISNFLPLLHLNTDGKILCEQKELFQEIYIKWKKDQTVKESET